MSNLLKKLKRGMKDSQLKSRDKRFQARKKSIENTLGAAAVQLEYESLDAMLEALAEEGGPFLNKPTVVRDYILDWRRKQNHGGTQTWYILCDLGRTAHTVVWTYTTTTSRGRLVNGGKVYNMTTTGVDDLMSGLLMD